MNSNLDSKKYLEVSQKGLQSLLNRNDLGFFQLPQRQDLWKSTQILAANLRQRYQHMVIIGIGGSSIGPRAILETLGCTTHHQLHFLDNVDPVEFHRLFQSLPKLEKVVWVLVSKSGSTIETLAGADFVAQKYRQAGLNFFEHVVVVTENRSNPLYDVAKEKDLPCLEIPLDVGGRFSVLTAVGMLPAAFIGADIEQFRQGALQALQDSKGVTILMSQYLDSFAKQKWISFFWFYCGHARFLGEWIKQLWAESLAKSVNRQGQSAPRVSTPVSAIGVSDQHSLLQQVMEGDKDKFVLFLRFLSSEVKTDPLEFSHFPIQSFFQGKTLGELMAAEASATEEALQKNGVMVARYSYPDLSPKSLGFFFMQWELIVGALGEVLDINAFDQPGVELGKRLAKEILKN